MSDTVVTELLSSVRAFLRSEIAPEIAGFKAYQLRVAMNSLAIVEREQGLLAELETLDNAIAQYTGLAEGMPVWQGLAVALRSGDVVLDPCDDKNASLMSLIKRRTLIKLAIDNPKYSGGRVAKERWGEAKPLSD